MKRFLYLLILPLLLLVSCDVNEPDPGGSGGHDSGNKYIPKDPAKMTLVVYAVASNDLYYFWKKDCDEILEGAQRIGAMGSDVQIVLYSVTPNAEKAQLSIVTKDEGKWSIKTFREYDRSIFSTDPKRISEVLNDVRDKIKSEKYGLILWSHASGWTPFLSQRDEIYSSKKRAFGLDKDNDKNEDRCDIIELADAIPEGMFDFLWFDACYMGSVEVAYEMARKVPEMVAYPSEIAGEGLPYHLILPFIAAEEPDLDGAAQKMADYFNASSSPYSVGHYNLTTPQLKNIKKMFQEVYAANPEPDNLLTLQKYSRSPFGPFYDLREYVRNSVEGLSGDSEALLQNFETALDEMVVYKSCSEISFNSYSSYNREMWDQEKYSGLSVWHPGLGSSAFQEYLHQTEWGKP